MNLKQKARHFIHKGQTFVVVVKERIVGIRGLARAGCRTQGFTINHRQGRKRGEIRISPPFHPTCQRTEVGPVNRRRRSVVIKTIGQAPSNTARER